MLCTPWKNQNNYNKNRNNIKMFRHFSVLFTYIDWLNKIKEAINNIEILFE
jgi:hypothetical protein